MDTASATSSSSSKRSKNPFADKIEQRVQQVNPADLVFAGNKRHEAKAHREKSSGHSYYQDRIDMKDFYDEFSIQYVKHCCQMDSEGDFENYKTLFFSKTATQRLYLPDMCIKIGKPDTEFSYYCLHSIFLSRSSYIEQELDAHQGKEHSFPVITLHSTTQVMTEILRFFYLREMCIDISKKELVADFCEMSAQLKNDDLNFAMLSLARYAQMHDQDKMNPFKRPGPRPVKVKMNRDKPYKKPEKRKKTSAFDPFGEPEEPGMESGAAALSNRQLLDKFLTDSTNLKQTAPSSNGDATEQKK